MGIIGKDFDYKFIKNFLSLEEAKLLAQYCEIKHRLNNTNFDFNQSNNLDTKFYGDPLMDALMINKKNFMEKETGKKLLETYSYWRTYTKNAILEKHIDRDSCEISVTVNIDNDGVDWPIFVDGKAINLKQGDAVIYLGAKLAHWRNQFDGDYYHQVFLHYVDKEGSNKNNYLDGRPYFGIEK